MKKLDKGKLLKDIAVALGKGKRNRETGKNHKIQNTSSQTLAWRPCENKLLSPTSSVSDSVGMGEIKDFAY